MAIEAFSLDTPRKYSPDERPRLDGRKRSFSPDALAEEGSEAETEDDLNSLRKKFVGEIDLPECEESFPGFTNFQTAQPHLFQVKNHS